MEEDASPLVSFLGRNYYRLQMGSGSAGLLVSAFFLVFNTFGIWKTSLEFYHIPLIPFVIVGICALFGFYWGSGFLIERIGLYKAMQSHMNREVNPDWADAYDKIKKMAEKLEVKK